MDLTAILSGAGGGAGLTALIARNLYNRFIELEKKVNVLEQNFALMNQEMRLRNQSLEDKLDAIKDDFRLFREAVQKLVDR